MVSRVLALCVAVAVAGCGPAKGPQAEQHFKDLLLLHFNNLNNEAELAKMDAKRERKFPDEAPSVGRQFNTYAWHPAGAVLFDVECPRCKTQHLVVTYRGDAILCSSCGSAGKDGKAGEPLVRAGLQPADLEAKYKDGVKPMFELKGEKEMFAIVRYVRRHWMLDNRGKIEVSAKVQEKSPIEAWAKKDTDKNYYGGEYHRLDGTYVATTAFLYDGSLRQIDAATVAKLVKGESLDRKTARFGAAVAIEEAVRPWNAPRKLDTPNVRSY